MILQANCHVCRGEGRLGKDDSFVYCLNCMGRGYVYLIKDANWTPYCIQTGDIKQKHIDIWYSICDTMRTLQPPDNIVVNCHWVCMVLALKLFPSMLEWHKGRFAEVNEHSWLVIKDSPKVIIDPYPIAMASGPILLTTEGCIANPWYRLYKGEAVI